MEDGVKRRRRAKKGIEAFRPELINRIDEIVVFKALDREAVRRLLKKMLDETLSGLEKKHHVTLRLSEGAESFLTSAGYSPEYGARELKRVVRQFVYVPLSELILSGRLNTHRRWLAEYGEDGISIVPDD
jgi:ATP-dependent Clp protease ATP-binding subunit ClpA